MSSLKIVVKELIFGKKIVIKLCLYTNFQLSSPNRSQTKKRYITISPTHKIRSGHKQKLNFATQIVNNTMRKLKQSS